MEKRSTAEMLGTLGYLLAMGAALLPQFRYAGFIITGTAWILLGISERQKVLVLAGSLLTADGLVSYISRCFLLGTSLLVCFIVLGVVAKGFEMYAHFKASTIYGISWFWWSGVARILVLILLAAFSAILAFIIVQAQAPSIDEALRKADPTLYHTAATLLVAGGIAELIASLLSVVAFSSLGFSKKK